MIFVPEKCPTCKQKIQFLSKEWQIGTTPEGMKIMATASARKCRCGTTPFALAATIEKLRKGETTR